MHKDEKDKIKTTDDIGAAGTKDAVFLHLH